MTLDQTNEVTLDVTASIDATGSKVDYVLDDESGYVLDMAAFLPEGHDAYAKARATLDLETSESDIEFDLPSASLDSPAMLAPADAIEAAEVDEYDYESQVMYALDDEHGFTVEQPSKPLARRPSVAPAATAPAPRLRSTSRNSAFAGLAAAI